MITIKLTKILNFMTMLLLGSVHVVYDPKEAHFNDRVNCLIPAAEARSVYTNMTDINLYL